MHVWHLALVLALLAALSACGVKGPPRPPRPPRAVVPAASPDGGSADAGPAARADGGGR